MFVILESDSFGKWPIVLVPLDGFFNSFLDRDRWLPIQEFFRFHYVRPGDVHIAFGAPGSVNDGTFPELLFNVGDKVVTRDWVPSSTEI